MNGAQDLGGMQSFGPIRPEAEAVIFHADWERRAMAIVLAIGALGKWNLDMSRAARESLPPAQYFASSYFEIWLAGLKKLLVDTGLATAEEIASGVSSSAGMPVRHVLMASEVAAVLRRGGPVARPAVTEARFTVGDEIVTRQLNPATHTRLPRYCRGRRARVIAVHGPHVFPDTNAIGLGEQPQWLYTVRFDASELWGKDTTASSVCVDCWESYLDYPDAAPD